MWQSYTKMTNGIEQKRVDSAVPLVFGNYGTKPVRALPTNDELKSLKAEIGSAGHIDSRKISSK